MKTELILKSDVLDIVFEHRNKAYGAYNLRKFYDNRLMRSLGMMIGVVVILSAFTFIPDKKPDTGIEDKIPVIEYGLPPVKEKPKEPEKPKQPAAPPQAKAAPVDVFVKPVIVDELTPVKTITTLSDSALTGSVAKQGEPGGTPVVGTPGDGGDGGEGKSKDPVTAPEIDNTTPRETADIMPSYPGGIEALRRFLKKNLNNPKEMEEGEEVSVKVKFVVGYDGKLQSFVNVQDGGEEFNKEVIRVLKKMPNWVPGKSNGQNVAVYFTIPVKFVPAD